MKVFISWSGETSKKAAEAFKEWLEQCIQSLEVFFSAEDIQKGSNWQAKLTNELKDTNYGIICLTSENASAPWIHFEAGALSKMLESKVMVVTLNIKFSDIVGPLSSYQATKIDEDDIFKLLQSINDSQDKPLNENKLKNSFNAFWPQLKKRLDIITKSAPTTPKVAKAEKTAHVDEVIDEILQLVRNQNAYIKNPEMLIPREYLESIINLKKSTLGEYVVRELYEFTKAMVMHPEVASIEGAAFSRFITNYWILMRRICDRCDIDMYNVEFLRLRESFIRMKHYNDMNSIEEIAKQDD